MLGEERLSNSFSKFLFSFVSAKSSWISGQPAGPFPRLAMRAAWPRPEYMAAGARFYPADQLSHGAAASVRHTAFRPRPQDLFRKICRPIGR